ncbi:MAG TPA: hypothetical protein VF844_19325 [Ktedonobacteraceae bacterium]
MIPPIKKAHRPAALKVSRFYAVEADAFATTQRLVSRMTTTPDQPGQNGQGSGSTAISLAPDNVSQEQDSDDDEVQRRGTWEKIVTYKTPRVSPIPVTPPSLPAVSGSPAGSTPPALIRVRKTPPKKPPRIPTRLFSWVSMLVLLGLLLGGVFGLVVTFSRGILAQPSHTRSAFSIQVTPSTVALGGIITLRGSGFSPSARVGLTRDANIALIDTGGANIIRADAKGSFSDTALVDPSWGAGPHVIRAEDAFVHKSASFTVIVTGQSASLRPSHLLFSTNALDLGSGDQATNSTQVITLSNAGGGQINWQATATQSWLMISPKSGTFSYGQNMQVVVASDRSNLKVGSYAASIIFTSNTGQATLPVKMSVTQLQPGHEAVLQLTPAVLSFTGTDGGISPPAQIVTVSNPGVLSLQWNATSSTNDGSGWLSVDPPSGTVTKGNSQAATISVNTSIMLPGVYSGSITFASNGIVAAKGSPQTIYVSLVVLPQCGIQVSPAGLSFADVYLQPPPARKIVSVGVSQGCSSSLRWSAFATTSNGGNWLSVGPTGGVTPAYPSVSVSATGLKPGTYSGSVIFSWSGGTQTLPVTFVMGQPTTPIVTAAPATIPFSAIIGQPGPVPQKVITLTNTGGGTLTWHATAATAVGGAWLAITPATGILASQQPAPITVTAKLLKTLTAGTYTATRTISGTDSLGHPAAGSPQAIPVSFVVQAPCAIATATPALVFQGAIGRPNPVAQAATITASGACANALTWTATAATTPAGGTWLTATPAAGTVSLTAPSTTSVGVALTGLTAGTYTGTVTLTAIDSITKVAVGTPKVIAVTLTVQPVCTLQAPSVTGATFSNEVGTNPATQTFTVGVTGACTGNVTITPTATMASGTGWLAVSPASATVASGGSATFTVTVASSALAAGSYTGSISLSAVNGGIAITGSPQAVGVTVTVLALPSLTAGPAIAFNVSTGIVSQPVTINNTGGEPLNWTAALGAGAPTYVSLSAASGTNLAAGASAQTNVILDATGLAGGTSVTTSVIISAIDPITGLTVAGSPVTVTVTINVPPPQMLLSSNTLAFTSTVGNNPAAQTINVQNTGGNTLTWAAGAPSQPWLAVTPTTGSDAAGQSTPLTLSVDVTGLAAGTYTATVVITPSVGNAVTVSVTLTIN